VAARSQLPTSPWTTATEALSLSLPTWLPGARYAPLPRLSPRCTCSGLLSVQHLALKRCVACTPRSPRCTRLQGAMMEPYRRGDGFSSLPTDGQARTDSCCPSCPVYPLFRAPTCVRPAVASAWRNARLPHAQATGRHAWRPDVCPHPCRGGFGTILRTGTGRLPLLRRRQQQRRSTALTWLRHRLRWSRPHLRSRQRRRRRALLQLAGDA
jgi:hypothetical protein